MFNYDDYVHLQQNEKYYAINPDSSKYHKGFGVLNFASQKRARPNSPWKSKKKITSYHIAKWP